MNENFVISNLNDGILLTIVGNQEKISGNLCDGF
jgi:hypothetical protein